MSIISKYKYKKPKYKINFKDNRGEVTILINNLNIDKLSYDSIFVGIIDNVYEQTLTFTYESYEKITEIIENSYSEGKDFDSSKANFIYKNNKIDTINIKIDKSKYTVKCKDGKISKEYFNELKMEHLYQFSWLHDTTKFKLIKVNDEKESNLYLEKMIGITEEIRIPIYIKK